MSIPWNNFLILAALSSVQAARVSVGLSAFLLVLSIPVWEAFARKEVRFTYIFAAIIRPPWAYVVAGCFIAFILPTFLTVLATAIFVVRACSSSIGCIGHSFLVGFLQLPTFLWCAMMVGYFLLWKNGKFVVHTRQTWKARQAC
jgi:hypothetical protein